MAVLETTDYAGFWIRVWALLIDVLILSVLEAGLYFLPLFFMQGSELADNHIMGAFYQSLFPIFMGSVVFIYFVIFEASLYQASPGKIAVGIKITDMDWQKPKLWQVLVRNLVKMVSWSCLFGYIFYFFTSEKQSLHDLASRTLIAIEPYKLSRNPDR